jgi:hypothetical protein
MQHIVCFRMIHHKIFQEAGDWQYLLQARSPRPEEGLWFHDSELYDKVQGID